MIRKEWRDDKKDIRINFTDFDDALPVILQEKMYFCICHSNRYIVMRKIYSVRSTSDYSRHLGQTDTHPLVSVIDFAEVSPIRHSLNSYSVYGMFMHEHLPVELTYGCGKYDYTGGTHVASTTTARARSSVWRRDR